jgi:hypothetical protein
MDYSNQEPIALFASIDDQKGRNAVILRPKMVLLSALVVVHTFQDIGVVTATIFLRRISCVMESLELRRRYSVRNAMLRWPCLWTFQHIFFAIIA